MIHASIRFFLLIITGFICINCHSDKQQSQGKKTKKELQKDSLMNYRKKTIQMHRGATKSDTLVINQQKFIRLSNNRYFEAIINMSGDIIIPGADYCHRAEFLDINNDKYLDVRVFVYSNTPNDYQNYFYDPKTQTFRRIEGEYLDIKNIKGTGLYYSYNRAGCADANWESHLTRIEN